MCEPGIRRRWLGGLFRFRWLTKVPDRMRSYGELLQKICQRFGIFRQEYETSHESRVVKESTRVFWELGLDFGLLRFAFLRGRLIRMVHRCPFQRLTLAIAARTSKVSSTVELFQLVVRSCAA